MRHDTLPADASPVSVSQPGLIRLSGPARALALDVLRINSLQTGAYVSHFKGRGMEFSQIREYSPGDDVRTIHWNVTARMNHPYVKEYVEERELTVIFLVDTSASLRFGTRQQFKSDLAAEITAGMAGVGADNAAAFLASPGERHLGRGRVRRARRR